MNSWETDICQLEAVSSAFYLTCSLKLEYLVLVANSHSA